MRLPCAFTLAKRGKAYYDGERSGKETGSPFRRPDERGCVFMSKVYAFLAPGLEEVECLAVVDVLRRGGVHVSLVSVNGDPVIAGSHGIRIIPDALFSMCDFSDADCLFLPGGMPGTKHLAEHAGLAALLTLKARAGTRIAAICAAPSVLGGLGLLDGRRATCYPGWEQQLGDADCTGGGVVTDGNITTARGLGFALDLGIELLSLLVSPEKAAEVKAAVQHPETI